MLKSSTYLEFSQGVLHFPLSPGIYQVNMEHSESYFCLNFLTFYTPLEREQNKTWTVSHPYDVDQNLPLYELNTLEKFFKRYNQEPCSWKREHSLNSKDYYELICWILSWTTTFSWQKALAHPFPSC